MANQLSWKIKYRKSDLCYTATSNSQMVWPKDHNLSYSENVWVKVVQFGQWSKSWLGQLKRST